MVVVLVAAKAISMRLSFTQLRQHQMHVVAPSFVPYMAPAPSPIHQGNLLQSDIWHAYSILQLISLI